MNIDFSTGHRAGSEKGAVVTEAQTHYYRAKYGSALPYDREQAATYARRIGDVRCAEWLERKP